MQCKQLCVSFRYFRGRIPYAQTCDEDDELFFVIEGSIVLETEKGNFELKQYEGVCVPKGTMHRPVAKEKAVVLMIENIGIDPIGKY